MTTDKSKLGKPGSTPELNRAIDMNQHWDSLDYRMIRLPTQITEALNSVLDHYLNEEMRDYENQSEGAQKNHVYRHLFLIRAWLGMPTGLEF